MATDNIRFREVARTEEQIMAELTEDEVVDLLRCLFPDISLKRQKRLLTNLLDAHVEIRARKMYREANGHELPPRH